MVRRVEYPGQGPERGAPNNPRPYLVRPHDYLEDVHMTEFEGVIPALAEALDKRGYTVLTPVQQAVLADGLTGADLLVSAQTGSGKTVAFGLSLGPTLLGGDERFSRAGVPLALVVAPTRELAMQITRELEWLYAPTGATIASCVGGMDMRAERQTLARGAHIVVGTPGRLRDHIERGSFDTSGLRAVVLDEADEMLDLGFREDLEYLLDAAPAERRTLMFSATVPRSIAGLAKRYQRDAIRIATTAEQKQHVDIEYRALLVAPNDRENAIINLLRYMEPKSALIFCGTRMMVNHMTSRFTNRGFSVVALSGELSQAQRSHALQSMRDGRVKICIATDVAARGIDLPDLELVVHAEIPRNGEALLHRSGRTGRAGRKGVSVLIVPHNGRRRVEMLLRSANVEASWGAPPSLNDIARIDRQRILDDAALSLPLNEDELAFAQELLARHGAEKVAAAFVRQHRAGLPAPEELIDNTVPEPQGPKKPRHDMGPGVWFTLSVGRKHNAEPRWLLPMLCRAGHITKNEIGAIRITPDETHVEVSFDAVDRFVESIGPGGKVEKTISITRRDSPPAGATSGPGPRPGGKPAYGDRKPDAPGSWAEKKRKFADKPASAASESAPRSEAKPWQRDADKPARPPRGDAPRSEAKPWQRDADKPARTLRVDAPRSEAKPWQRDADKPARPPRGGDAPVVAKPWQRDGAKPARPARGGDAPSEAKPWQRAAGKPARAGKGGDAVVEVKPWKRAPGKPGSGGYAGKNAATQAEAKPWERGAGKPKGKKPFKAKFTKPGKD